MKALTLSTLLLPLISTISLLPSTATAQQGVCLTRSIIYGVPRTWFLYISNYTQLSSQPGWNNDVLDPTLTVTEEQVNYLDGSASGIPPRGPYATSKKDFIAKVKKGLQFPYREYVGEITYSLEQLEADEYECDALTAGFTATAQTVKTKESNVPAGSTVTWNGIVYFTLSNTNGTYRIASATTSQDWFLYLSGAGVPVKPKYT